MKRMTLYFDNEHTLSADLQDDEVESFLEWLYNDEKIYKLATNLRTYYVAKMHIRHVNVSKI